MVNMETEEPETFEIALPHDQFDEPLRNMRVALDGTDLIVELIPSIVRDEPVGRVNFSDDPKIDDALNNMIGTGKGKPIVEADRLMRVHFRQIRAVMIQEEFVELEPSLTVVGEMPGLRSRPGVFPLLKVHNSRWRARLPDYQGGDWPDLVHYKLQSMETHMDILGVLVKTEWLPND